MTHDQPNPAYETVAAAIRFVRGHALTQPSLDEVARHVGLSPSHLQRVFSDWAGISPKRFLQFLTKENAKTLLRESRDVLSAAIESGLSGPGRLHDLMVNCEALTPGEIGALGEGLVIRCGFAASPFGTIIIGSTVRGICHLRFVEPGETDIEEASLHTEWPHAQFDRDDEAAQRLATDLFDPFSEPKPLSLLLRGTNFQIKVWEALLRIPSGHTLSYGDLAAMATLPKAQRAVGTAMAHNRIAVLIPCHRVIRESGEAGLYRWGADRKRAIIGWEQSRRVARNERETGCAE
jgi:AraC family transcriptional regulator of adaptative response/methylated-DNA-[protein]-cysteine methyltransferase